MTTRLSYKLKIGPGLKLNVHTRFFARGQPYEALLNSSTGRKTGSIYIKKAVQKINVSKKGCKKILGERFLHLTKIANPNFCTVYPASNIRVNNSIF